MEKLLLIGLIVSLPMSLFGLVAKLTGSKLLGLFLFRLPSITVMAIMVIYLLKIFKII